jgi:exopolyphosphatase / guanosine-5'-triphosphate,3'-diphosphate pyrophosphatase
LTHPLTSSDFLAEQAIHRDIAVIDVGSNSVRLVHFRVEGRSLWPIFNEKVMAGLGRGVHDTGKLHPEGREIALRALKRFQRLLDAKGVSDRHVVATAAVRNASDGPDFIEAVAERTGLVVRVLSGADEARLSAMGVGAGIPDADGLMGDLGGSSLELTGLDGGLPARGVSTSLGPQEMLGDGPMDEASLVASIDAQLLATGQLTGQGGRFYAVGGAWRALGQLAFARFGYPLNVVHEFALTAARADELARLAQRLSPASLRGTAGVSSRRVATLPYAALLLRRIMHHGRFDKLVFSAYGVREGVLAAGLPPALLALDPLIAGAEAMARPNAPTPDFGRALARWLVPAFGALETAFGEARDSALHEAATRLTDLGARHHPDHRADLARDVVLYAPFAGIAHAERVFLAAAIHYRYGGRRARLEDDPIFHLISEDQHNLAQMLGLSLRLGAKLSGRSPALLDRYTLSVEADVIRLEVDESVRDLYVERSVSLLDQLAAAVGRTGEVVYVTGQK